MYWVRSLYWLTWILLVFHITPGSATDLLLIGSDNNPLLQRWNSTPITPIAQWEVNGSTGVITLKAVLATLSNTTLYDRSADKIQTNPSIHQLCERYSEQIIVSLDRLAAHQILKNCNIPLVMLGISQEEFAIFKSVETKKNTVKAAICLEANPILNLTLIRTFLPTARTIALLRPQIEPVWLSALQYEARRLKLNLREVVVDGDLQGLQALRNQISGLDAILLPPDDTLINEWSLKPLLLMAIRQGVPVFGGLTDEYITAGVLAGVLIDEHRLLEQIQHATKRIESNPTRCSYATAVRVAVNPAVARTLGFSDGIVNQARLLFSGH